MARVSFSNLEKIDEAAKKCARALERIVQSRHAERMRGQRPCKNSDLVFACPRVKNANLKRWPSFRERLFFLFHFLVAGQEKKEFSFFPFYSLGMGFDFFIFPPPFASTVVPLRDVALDRSLNPLEVRNSIRKVMWDAFYYGANELKITYRRMMAILPLNQETENEVFKRRLRQDRLDDNHARQRQQVRQTRQRQRRRQQRQQQRGSSPSSSSTHRLNNWPRFDKQDDDNDDDDDETDDALVLDSIKAMKKGGAGDVIPANMLILVSKDEQDRQREREE